MSAKRPSITETPAIHFIAFGFGHKRKTPVFYLASVFVTRHLAAWFQAFYLLGFSIVIY